jgi:hypothetical protein
MRDDAGGEWIGRGFMRMRDALRLGGEGRVECGLVHVRGSAGEGWLEQADTGRRSYAPGDREDINGVQ